MSGHAAGAGDAPARAPWPARVEAVLFDLDGTLIDSAPDLAGAANDLRAELGLAPRPYAALRPMVGAGARGMLGAGLDVHPGDPRFDALRDRFLALYEQRMTRETAPFAAIGAVLDRLEHAGLPWGIVTNKAERFTRPLVAALGLDVRAAAVIAGDTTPHAKPHPAPLLEAARRMARPAHGCLYVGDDRRDIVAGHAAGMGTVAAAWGYLGAGEPIGAWGAHHVIDSPESLLNLVGLA